MVVKAAQFSFTRLPGADPTLGVEMASTGEVACFGDDLEEALLKSLISTGFRRPVKGVLMAIGTDKAKASFVPYARLLAEMGLELYATPGTAKKLAEAGIASTTVYKLSENKSPSSAQTILDGNVDLVINVPEGMTTQKPEMGTSCDVLPWTRVFRCSPTSSSSEA